MKMKNEWEDWLDGLSSFVVLVAGLAGMVFGIIERHFTLGFISLVVGIGASQLIEIKDLLTKANIKSDEAESKDMKQLDNDTI